MVPRSGFPAPRLSVWLPVERGTAMPRAEFWLVGGLALTLAACSLAPPLKVPEVPTGDTYQEIGPWTQAQPSDRLPRDSWWTLYETAELNELEKKLIDGNPTLAAAVANYAQARALSDQARAGLFPTLGVSAGIQRNRTSSNAPLTTSATPAYYNDNSFGGGVSYELD